MATTAGCTEEDGVKLMLAAMMLAHLLAACATSERFIEDDAPQRLWAEARL